MRQFLEKLLKLKTLHKVGITAAAMLVICAFYYFVFYSDLADGITAAKAEHQRLTEEKTSYEKRKIEYLAYRAELTQLQEEQRELLKALPKRAEIPSFLSNIQDQAELSGLEILNLQVDPEVPEELYVRIPVRMEVQGSYHAVAKFFKNIGELRRIVNVSNLSLTPVRPPNDDGRAAPKVRAKFIAATFRYPDGSKGGGT